MQIYHSSHKQKPPGGKAQIFIVESIYNSQYFDYFVDKVFLPK